jgi:hypothetical protein
MFSAEAGPVRNRVELKQISMRWSSGSSDCTYREEPGSIIEGHAPSVCKKYSMCWTTSGRPSHKFASVLERRAGQSSSH